MSQRTLLRPMMRTGFDPRQISGLALWLDAADSSTLYTTDAGPVTAVSAPTEISGCIGWWDASDASSITQSGGLVSQWNDKSGNGRHLSQATSANRPSCTTRTLNGRAVLEFDGSNDLLSLADGSGNPTYGIDIATSRAVTIIAVFASDVTNSIRDLLSLQRTGKNSNDTGVYVRRHTNLSGSVEFAAGAGNSATNDQTDKNNIRGFANTSTDAMMVSFAVSASAGVYAAHMNGAGQSLTLRFGTLPATGFLQEGTGGHTLDIGASRNFGNSLSTSVWDGIVAEVVMFNAALSTADRARVEAYLAAKWGISGVHAQATATNDPVGAWLDKSGNGYHATQATGAARPTLARNHRNGRSAVTWDGSRHMTVASFPVTNHFCGIAVASFASGNRGVFARGAANDWNSLWYDGTNAIARTQGNVDSTQPISTNTFYTLAFRGSNTIGGALNTALLRVNGVAGSTATSTIAVGSPALDRGLTVGGLSATLFRMSGTICEIIYYQGNSAAIDSTLANLERYAAQKWGITLVTPPTVSNADAQDWINRVYGNGGTVSAATASAVNQFCVDIENAGIRDRFYRLNLFCGNSDANLAAVRTPLFRGPSLTGAQFGNATDTNVNFVQGDYAETGASGGLVGNGTSKRLSTGFAPNDLPSVATGHCAAWKKSGSTGSLATMIGVRSDASSTSRYSISKGAGAAAAFVAVWGKNNSTGGNPAASNDDAGLVITSRESASDLKAFFNGTQIGVVNSTPTSPDATSAQFFVFADNLNTVPQSHWPLGLCGYSVGLSLTAPQASSYYSAMLAFQTALGRQA